MTSSESAGCTDRAKVLFDASPTLLSALTLFMLPVTPAALLACTYAESTRDIIVAESVPGVIVIVLVAPEPVAVTFVPTKLRVVPAVDRLEPSSCTVIPLVNGALLTLRLPVMFTPESRVSNLWVVS